jgi:peroxin-6
MARFTLHPSLSLSAIAATLPFTFTGADLYALCSDAMLKAITRQASAVDQKIKNLPNGPVTPAYFFDHYATNEDVAVMVTEEDFQSAHCELVPSVSAKELEHYDRVRKQFEATDEKKQVDTLEESQTGPPISFDARPQIPPNSSKIKSKAPSKWKGKSTANSWTYSEGEGDSREGNISTMVEDEDDDDDDDDDDYIIKTDNLTINGNGHAMNGSPKGKGSIGNVGFEDPSVKDDEELYS